MTWLWVILIVAVSGEIIGYLISGKAKTLKKGVKEKTSQSFSKIIRIYFYQLLIHY
jgi:hypothetical protein